MQIDPEKLGIDSTPPERIAGMIAAAESRMRATDLSYMPVYPGGQKQFSEDCQVLAVAWMNNVKELRLWRWLTHMNCTVQRAAVAPWEGDKWFVTDVDNVVIGDGASPVAAIEDAKEKSL